MAAYRLLSDHYIGDRLLPAGSTQVTRDADPNGNLPAGWTPTPSVDPIDQDAVDAFYALGFREHDQLIRKQFDGSPVLAPTTYWRRDGQTATLTGLGRDKPPISIFM